MKYKKELRWLAFILGPFIAMLSLYVIIPLQITTSFLNIFNEVYGFTSAGLHFRNSARSMHLQNSKIIRSNYEELALQLNFFVGISTSKINAGINASEHNNTLLNAFMIEQNSPLLFSEKNKINEYSIWFDINNKYHNLQDLPAELQNYVNSFKSL